MGLRQGSDPALLCLWCRLVVTAPIRPLAWEPPNATGAALEKAKRQKKKKKKEKERDRDRDQFQIFRREGIVSFFIKSTKFIQRKDPRKLEYIH